MKRLFLSYFLGQDTPFYGGKSSFQIDHLCSMVAGDSCNSSRWSFPNHGGTHIDLPRHFVADGKSLNDYKPDFWIFNNVALIEISILHPGSIIDLALFADCQVPVDADLLLLKTGFGRFRNSSVYWQNSPVFRPELADYFRTKFPSLRAFGFDSISVSSWSDRITGRAAHRAFLGGETPILLIEDMDLTKLDAAEPISKVIVAPLLVGGTDASPCTIIAEVADL